MKRSEFSSPGSLNPMALSRFRCDACGQSIRSSRPLTLGRTVRCPIRGARTEVLVAPPDPEIVRAPGAIALGKMDPPPVRSGLEVEPAATPSPSPSRKAAAANYPAVRGYTILGEIGRGATGVVYRARHDALKRVVALKILKVDDDRPAVLLGEAEAVAKLHQPNIDRSNHDPKLYDALDKSPKLDWKEGEVCGIIEVIRPMDEDYEKTGDLLARALGAALLAGSAPLLAGRAFLGAARRRAS